jgi:GTPase SAR1 family protein
VGDSSVGKTSLVNRFVWDDFKSTYQSTVGASYMAKTTGRDKNRTKFRIWDTGISLYPFSFLSSFFNNFFSLL